MTIGGADLDPTFLGRKRLCEFLGEYDGFTMLNSYGPIRAG